MDYLILCETLWRRATRLGAIVQYDGFMDDGEGSFHPDPCEAGEPCPQILLGRPFCEEGDGPSRARNADGGHLPEPDLRRDAVALAHEIGHLLSWKERTPRADWDAYFLAAKKRDAARDSVPTDPEEDYNERLRATVCATLTRDEVDRILDEEARAWAIGRELLKETGFSDFAYYEDSERKGLHSHRYHLGVDELREAEVQPRRT